MKPRPQRLKAFFDDLVEHFGWWKVTTMNLPEFLVLAEMHGLIEWDDYDPKRDKDIDAEEGDRVWRPTKR